MYAIDTAEAIRKLTAADMPEAQARVIVDTFKHPDAEIATKTDLEALRQEITGLKQELKADIKGLKQELRQEFGKELETGINGLRQELKADIEALRQEIKADSRELRAEFRTELKWIKWAIGANLGFTLLIVLKLVFF